MPVTVVTVRAGHLIHGNHAAVKLFAAHVLKLNGGVADVKLLFEHAIEPYQNAGALRWRDVGNGHMTGQRAGV